ncbi:MAG TPA: methionine--tRNA ligase [Rikenellaceae bacterium]|nr:methionine--tRNA ligase [Rikenellaceae bacterium]
MEKNFKRTLVTCALPYANGPIHIGHLAGVYVPADIYVRFLRLKGKEVLYICGSDEHGVPITIQARKRGCSPQEIVDEYHKIISDSFKGFGINFDIYGRTTSKIHENNASQFFRKLYDEGKFITKETEQYYDPVANTFLADRYIVGTCPKCGSEGAYGDQCEKCGSTLSPEELINPTSKLSGAQPIKKKTKHWYLPLQDYEQWLREWILDGHKEWRSNVYGQVKSWLDGGLQPRAVTRDLDWGVPVPVKGAEGKVLYVWFDAPIGYISNTMELLPNDWEKWWKSEDTKLVHFIGKDNIVFHCIVFPSMLKAYGDGFIMPENVPANEFLNLEGDKISTSRGWAVWANEYLEDFPGKQDVMRYVLTANAPETKDNDFSWKDFQSRNNSELVAIFGNFVNRAVVLTHKYFRGVVPPQGQLQDIDRDVLAQLPELKISIDRNIENYRFRDALRDAMSMARIGNKYISDTEPWKVAKTDIDRTATILNICLQICASLSVVFEPFTPFAAARLRTMLDVPLDWSLVGRSDILKAGHTINTPELLFEKIEDDQIQAQLDRLKRIREQREADAKAQEASEVAAQKKTITFEDFDAMDIRTATVLEAQKVPKTDKLLKLTIDTGIDTRVIVSGIAEYYSPEEMIGKQICILANLAPRTIRGIESKGMILMARQSDGKMRFITPAEALANGAQVG